MAETIKYHESDGTSHTLTVADTYRYIDGKGLYEWFAVPVIDEMPANIDVVRDFAWTSRSISLDFAVSGTSYQNTQANMRALFGYFVPDITAGTAGTLEVVVDAGGTYQITAAPRTPRRGLIGPKAARVTLNFECPEFFVYLPAGSVNVVTGSLQSNGNFSQFTGTIDDGTSDVFTGWTNSGVNDGNGNKAEASGTAYGGTVGLKLITTTARTSTYQSFSVSAGEVFYTTAWARGPGAGGTGTLQLYDVDGAAQIVAGNFNNGTAWALRALTGTIPTGCETMRVYCYGPPVATPGTQYCDVVVVTKTKAAAVFNNAGDVPAYPKFVLTGNIGTATITYPNANYIQIGTVTANNTDNMTVYTKPGQLRVDYDEIGGGTVDNWTGYAGTVSSFDTLPVGAGTVFLAVTSGTPVFDMTWDVYRTGIG